MKKIITASVVFFSLLASVFAQDLATNQAKAKRDDFVNYSKKYIGYPYVYGAVGPDCFDCSGLIYYVAKESVGIQMPRTSKAMYSFCKIVSEKDREPGDLVFFATRGGDEITHVGIYIGRNQFISAISDGPNTGVIVSSLTSDYWKGKYYATGQFLKPTKEPSEAPSKKGTKNYAKKSSSDDVIEEISVSYLDEVPDDFLHSIFFDSEVFCNWALLSPTSFMFRFRGIDLSFNAFTNYVTLNPGVGLGLRFNTSLNTFQIPVVFSATINEFVKIYAGPVFSFKNGVLLDTEKEIRPSIFPGMMGISLSTPSLKAGPVRLQICQDISYSVFNKMDNSALSIRDSVSAGLILHTGVKVVLPLEVFL